MNNDPNVKNITPLNSEATDSATTFEMADTQVRNHDTIGGISSTSSSQKVTEANSVLPLPIVPKTRRVKEGNKNSTNQTQSTLTMTNISNDPIILTDRVEPKRTIANEPISSSKSAMNVKKQVRSTQLVS